MHGTFYDYEEVFLYREKSAVFRSIHVQEFLLQVTVKVPETVL